MRGGLWALVFSLVTAADAGALQYDQQRAQAIEACERIHPAAYQSGLWLNPDGYRSYYERSRCFQDAAVRFRDAALCAQVRRRWSLFSSSWGYSASRCRTLVAEGQSEDRAALEALKRAYAAGPMTFAEVRIVANGNGRDIDIIPRFRGSYAQGYRLTFEILRPEAQGGPVLLYSDGHHLDKDESNLYLYVPSSDIRRRFPAFEFGGVYTVRGTVALSIAAGGPSGYRSDAFLESVFPARERSQSVTWQTAVPSARELDEKVRQR
jgi:hypothetical protein